MKSILFRRMDRRRFDSCCSLGGVFVVWMTPSVLGSTYVVPTDADADGVPPVEHL